MPKAVDVSVVLLLLFLSLAGEWVGGEFN